MFSLLCDSMDPSKEVLRRLAVEERGGAGGAEFKTEGTVGSNSTDSAGPPEEIKPSTAQVHHQKAKTLYESLKETLMGSKSDE